MIRQLCPYKILIVLIFFVRTYHSQVNKDIDVLQRAVVKSLPLDPTKSIRFSRAQLVLGQSAKNKRAVVWSYVNLIAAFVALNQSDSVRVYLRRLDDINIFPFGDSLYAVVCNHKGTFFYNQGMPDSAFKYHEKALIIREKLGYRSEEIKSYFNLGKIADLTGDENSMRQYFSKAAALAQKIDDKYTEVLALEGQAAWHVNYGSLDTAIALYRSAAQKYNGLGRIIDEGRCYENIATAFDYLGSGHKSLSNYRVAAGLFAKANAGAHLSSCFNNMAGTFISLKLGDSALIYVRRSMALSPDKMQLIHMPEILHNAAKAHALLNNSDSALLYYQKKTSIEDSIFRLEMLKSYKKLEQQYEQQKNREEILNLGKTRRLLFALSLTLACLCLMLYIIYRIRVRSAKALAEKNEQLYRKQISEIIKEQELKTISGIMEGQENERKRIAEDLHDRLGSMLATVKLHFNAIESKMESIELKNIDQYNRANKLLDEVCNEVRRIAHNMESGVLVNFGLVAALTDLKEALEHSSTLSIHINSYGMYQRLNADDEISLYRIIQELLSNVIKHARATEVNIDINRSETQLTLVVTDNGQGFDASDAAGRNGMGLKNIQSRVSKLQGKFFVDSGKGNGTTTIIEIPLNHEQADHS